MSVKLQFPTESTQLQPNLSLLDIQASATEYRSLCCQLGMLKCSSAAALRACVSASCNPITLKAAFKSRLLQMKYFRALRPQHRAPGEVPCTQLQLFGCPGHRWWQKPFEGWGCSNTWITFSGCKFSSGKNESYFSYALLDYLPFKCLWRLFLKDRNRRKAWRELDLPLLETSCKVQSAI